jgi:hypothetical protein
MLENAVIAAAAARWVQPLSALALGCSAGFLVLFVLMGRGVVPQSYFAISLLFSTAVLAPIIAVAGVVSAKLSGQRVPKLARAALAASFAVFLWPLLFFVSFSSCPQGVC